MNAEPITIRHGYVRWGICALLFFVVALNYIDRSVLGLIAPTMQKDLAISDQEYATVINFFLIAYGVAYLMSGRIVDKLGVRLSMARAIATRSGCAARNSAENQRSIVASAGWRWTRRR